MLTNPLFLTYIIGWLIGFSVAVCLSNRGIRHAIFNREENGEYYDTREYVDVTDKLIEDAPSPKAKVTSKPREYDTVGADATLDQIKEWLARNPDLKLELKP